MVWHSWLSQVNILVTVRNSSCGKVMFLQVSVCPHGGGVHPRADTHPLGRHPHCSGRVRILLECILGYILLSVQKICWPHLLVFLPSIDGFGWWQNSRNSGSTIAINSKLLPKSVVRYSLLLHCNRSHVLLIFSFCEMWSYNLFWVAVSRWVSSTRKHILPVCFPQGSWCGGCSCNSAG